jgi:hypothetical protein
VVGSGTWREIVLYGGGRRIDENCAMVGRDLMSMKTESESESKQFKPPPVTQFVFLASFSATFAALQLILASPNVPSRTLRRVSRCRRRRGRCCGSHLAGIRGRG